MASSMGTVYKSVEEYMAARERGIVRPHTSDGTSSPVTSATADSARPPHTRTSIPGNGAGAPCGSQTVTDGRILVTSCTPSTALTNGHSTGTPKPDAPYASTSSSGGTRPAANGTTISAAGGAPTRGPYVVGPRKAFAETPQSKVVSRQSVGANGTVYPARGDKVIWKATGYSAAIENGSPGACAAEVARQLDAADGVMDGLCFGRPIVMSTNRTVPSPVPATATAAPATTAQPAVDHRTVAQHLKVLQGLQAQLEGQLELLRPSLLTVPKRPRTASTSSSADDPVTSHLKVLKALHRELQTELETLKQDPVEQHVIVLRRIRRDLQDELVQLQRVVSPARGGSCGDQVKAHLQALEGIRVRLQAELRQLMASPAP